MKKRLFTLMVTIWASVTPLGVVYAQFQTLEDKYGTSTSTPVQQKAPDETTSATKTTGSTGSSATSAPPGMVYIGGKEWPIEEMIKQVALWTGKHFLLEGKIKGDVAIIADGYIPIDMAVQAFYSALETQGYTTYETPSGMIRVIKQSESKTKPKDLFRDKMLLRGNKDGLYSDKLITRIINLENISANEIQQVIKDMISKNGSSFAYPATNSIIITDTGSNIDHVLKLVKELDTSGPQEVLEVIAVANADAKDIAEKIKTIFNVGKEQSGSVSRRSSRRRSRRNQTAELEDVQAISQVIADERTNSLLIMGSKRSIAKVRALIARLDRALDGAEGNIQVYTLKYANATEMEETLSKLVSGASSSSSSSKASSSNSSSRSSRRSNRNNNNNSSSSSSSGVSLEGGVKVIADEQTNQLIIMASPKDFNTLVEHVIAKLDIPRPSVYLEAVIMSMDISKTNELGLSGLFGGVLGSVAGNSLTAFGGVLPLTPVSAAGLLEKEGGVAGGIVSDTTIEFTGIDGTTTTIPTVGAIMNALTSNTDVNVLASPHLLALDNEEARIKVGQQVPVVTAGSLSTGAVNSFSVERQDVGLILSIKPQISDGDMVRLELEQTISNVFSTSDTLGPTLDEDEVKTTVVAKNRQTIVIAGLIDDKQQTTVHKVPLLGDIPVVGNLFKNKQTTNTKSNLVIFITPYIVRESADNFAILKKKIEERNQFIDMNFGKKQRKLIRRAIEDHAKELLEFRCDLSNMDNPCFAQNSYQDSIQKTNTYYAPSTSQPTTTTTATTSAPAQTSSTVSTNSATTSTSSTTSTPTTTTSDSKNGKKKSWDPPRKTKYKN